METSEAVAWVVLMVVPACIMMAPLLLAIFEGSIPVPESSGEEVESGGAHEE